MIRMCTFLAVCELALLGAFFGTPAAQADPAEECCSEPRHSECSGCIANYLLGEGNLWGCIDAGRAFGCDVDQKMCNSTYGPSIRWRDGSNCTIFQEVLYGNFEVYMPGCDPVECD